MIKHLLIPSGSTSGLVMLGIFKSLIENNYIKVKDIESIHASSVGAIIATILCLNFDWQTVYDYIIERPWEKVVDIHPLTIMQSIANKGFFCSYDLSKKFFLPLFKAKDIEIDITMKQFYDLTNVELFFYVCDIQDLSSVEISHKTDPDLELVKAIAMAGALPIVFQPVEYKNSLYCDGGLVNAFPLKETITYIMDKNSQDETSFDENCLQDIFCLQLIDERNTISIKEIVNGTLLDFLMCLFRNIILKKIQTKYSTSKITNIIQFNDDTISFSKLKKAVNRSDRIELLSKGEDIAKNYLVVQNRVDK